MKKKKILLALQGGGALGAYSWGVLDRLLDDDRIEIVGVSGGSAGAMNAVALAYGLDKGSKQDAKDMLQSLWSTLEINDIWDDMPGGKPWGVMKKGLDKVGITPKFRERSRTNVFAVLAAILPDKYLEKIRDIRIQEKLNSIIDFDKFRNNTSGIPVYINASDMIAQSQIIFDRENITDDSIAASSAIPGIFPPVKINGRDYYDAGMIDNPVIPPLLNHSDAHDVMIVQTINAAPSITEKMPENYSALKMVGKNYVNKSIRRHIDGINKCNKLIEKFPEETKKMGYKTIYTHLIDNKTKDSEKTINMLHFTEAFLKSQHDAGYSTTDEWLKNNFDSIGQKSTYNEPLTTYHKLDNVAKTYVLPLKNNL